MDSYNVDMTRILAGFTLMLAGPWLVMLAYTLLLSQYWYNPASSYISLALAFGIGIVGIKLANKLYANWALHFKLLGIVIFTFTLALYVVYAGLLSACSIGDCL